MLNVLEQLVRNEQLPAQAATSEWSVQNNLSKSPASSVNSSVRSIDSYTAGQYRAAAAVREKSTIHTGSGQQAPPPSQDLTYLKAHTRPTHDPEPITPYPLLQDELPIPARFPSIQDPVSTIDLDDRNTNIYSFTKLDSAHQNNSNCILRIASRSGHSGEDNIGKKSHGLALDPQKIHSFEIATESSNPTSPPKPKPTIANLFRKRSCNLTPKEGVLKRVLSFIPRWLSHRSQKRETTCEAVATSNDAGGGKK
ncbi:hypothetical protein L211DRAFT_851695 [Terfezia boudieri ATCC MYA-4762]|uniref:Uncharacterized protein n=1 Tax=Terfezia boudieri ATCC MYA-4762 TaxID=1051890 RepID=A0A3N4LHM6_9PEZI|nr:hypothetical protein L211DRAFT_851695 [Terfezia boudieri ATCC MYA-4762]